MSPGGYRDDETAARARLAALEAELASLEAEEPSIEARALANRLDRLEARIAEAHGQLPGQEETPARSWRRLVFAIWLAALGFATLVFVLTRC